MVVVVGVVEEAVVEGVEVVEVVEMVEDERRSALALNLCKRLDRYKLGVASGSA